MCTRIVFSVFKLKPSKVVLRVVVSRLLFLLFLHLFLCRFRILTQITEEIMRLKCIEILV